MKIKGAPYLGHRLLSDIKNDIVLQFSLTDSTKITICLKKNPKSQWIKNFKAWSKPQIEKERCKYFKFCWDL